MGIMLRMALTGAAQYVALVTIECDTTLGKQERMVGWERGSAKVCLRVFACIFQAKQRGEGEGRYGTVTN